MAKLLIAFSESLLADLEARPGRSKLEKQKAAIPRLALLRTLARLSRDMEKPGGAAHLKSDVLDEPHHVRENYLPEELSALLVNFKKRTSIPEDSLFFPEHSGSYIASFVYEEIGWTVFAAYLELKKKPVLVFFRAMEKQLAADYFKKDIAGSTSAFDDHFRIGWEVATGLP